MLGIPNGAVTARGNKAIFQHGHLAAQEVKHGEPHATGLRQVVPQNGLRVEGIGIGGEKPRASRNGRRLAMSGLRLPIIERADVGDGGIRIKTKGGVTGVNAGRVLGQMVVTYGGVGKEWIEEDVGERIAGVPVQIPV